MGLLLPILLLGLAQPVDASAQVVQTQAASESIAPHQFTLSRPQFSVSNDETANGAISAQYPFDHIVRSQDPGEGKSVCLTMRSYYFRTRNGRAPEYVGMTTCDRSGKRALRNVDRPAHVEPAY